MRFANILAVFIATVACQPQLPSNLSSAESASGDAFVAIAPDATGDRVKMWLSSTKHDRLGLCFVAESERCDSKHRTHQVASKVFEKNGRRILGFSDQVQVHTASGSYVVVADDGSIEAKFTMADAKASGDPLTTGLSLIKRESLVEELTYVAGDEFKGRLSATPENDKVADWLIIHLKRLGIEAGIANYRQTFVLGKGPTSSGQTANIIGKIEGSDPTLKNEYVVIGAHMDHTGTLQRGYTCSSGGAGDSICNGADDNASGTIAVLNVAKALAAVKGSLKRSVLIMWFSGEEEGLIGSWKYARSPVVPLNKTIYMVNMDMVGYSRTAGNRIAALGGGTSTLGKGIIQQAAKKYPSNSVYFTNEAGGGSDHVPFMYNGIPGVFFHTGVANNPNYHRTSDHSDKIDFDGMLVAAKIAFETVLNVANSPAAVSVGYAEGERKPLITEEESQQACHHLINNPFIIDFTRGNEATLPEESL